jgi:exosortase
MSTNVTASDDFAPDALRTLWDQGQSKDRLWALVAAIVVFGLAYWSCFYHLVMETWYNDPNYSHGFLIIPIAVWMFWQRLPAPEPKKSLGAATGPAAWWGWVALAVVLVARGFAYERNQPGWENATIVPAVASLVWTFGGWPLLRRTWVAVAYLVFMLPLPSYINMMVALPLQAFAATGSCFLLQLTGLWAIQTGNVIDIRTAHGMEPLDVALACNGLRMLMTMAAIAVAFLILIPLPIWKRIILLLMIVPIALFSNMIRITITGWCYYLFAAWYAGMDGAWGPKAKEWAHNLSGLLMPLLAMLQVWIVLKILSWLVPQEDETGDDRQVMLPQLTER